VCRREESLLQDSHKRGETMIIVVKTPGSQVGFPAGEDIGEKVKGGGEREGFIYIVIYTYLSLSLKYILVCS